MSDSSNQTQLTNEADVANKFLELQSKELDVRIKEAECGADDLQNQKEIALASIQAQVQDRSDGRQTISQESTKSKIFIFVVLVVVCIFILALVFLEQSEMAQKIIEIVVTGILGAFGGYGFAIQVLVINVQILRRALTSYAYCSAHLAGGRQSHTQNLDKNPEIGTDPQDFGTAPN